MNLRQPPALAVWLLARLGLTGRNEPLTGDLLEEFRNVRTAAWYWRQTFRAIVAGLGHGVSIFRLDLLALLVGCGAETGIIFAVWLFHAPYGARGVAWGFLALATVWLAMHAKYRFRLRGQMNSGDEDGYRPCASRIFFRRIALVSFACAVIVDSGRILEARDTGFPWWPFLPSLAILNLFLLAGMAVVVLWSGERPHAVGFRGRA